MSLGSAAEIRKQIKISYSCYNLFTPNKKTLVFSLSEVKSVDISLVFSEVELTKLFLFDKSHNNERKNMSEICLSMTSD